MNKSVALHAQEAKSWKEKCFGLIGKKPYPILIRTRFGIHTFGMRYSIDVIVFNDRNEIVSLRANLLPNRFFFWNPRFNMVIELPAGTIRRKRLQKGNICRLV